MGKKKDKWKSMSITERNEKMRKIGKEMGVDPSRYTKTQGVGANAGGDTFDEEAYNEAVKNRFSNDYSVRSAMESAAMAGNKKAEKFARGGIGSMKAASKARDLMEKWHGKHGNGGNFSSPADYAGVSMTWKEEDRERQTAAYDDKYAKTTDLNKLKDELMAQATDKAAGTPIEPSDRMAAVEERFEKAAGNSPPSMFDKDNADPAKADDQADAARTFANDYKLDVAKGARIKSDIETGISNAAEHVRDTYGR